MSVHDNILNSPNSQKLTGIKILMANSLLILLYFCIVLINMTYFIHILTYDKEEHYFSNSFGAKKQYISWNACKFFWISANIEIIFEWLHSSQLRKNKSLLLNYKPEFIIEVNLNRSVWKKNAPFTMPLTQKGTLHCNVIHKICYAVSRMSLWRSSHFVCTRNHGWCELTSSSTPVQRGHCIHHRSPIRRLDVVVRS